MQFTILTKSEDGPCLYWCTGAGECLQAVADTLRLEKRSHTLIACQSADWDRDYSPWPAPPVFGKQGFAGQGEQTLAKIRAFFTQDGAAERPRAIGGYSLAGLFSLWALSQDAGFAGAASCSGSLWYPGWAEYAQARYPQGSCVYLSLGERGACAQCGAGQSRDATRARSAALLADAGIEDTTLVWHPGGHFDQPDGADDRRGLAWLLKKL
ncbi:MAG: hypothetical protein V8Q82_01665 [Christensenellales bacterium]